jgi:hypothetical protein
MFSIIKTVFRCFARPVLTGQRNDNTPWLTIFDPRNMASLNAVQEKSIFGSSAYLRTIFR